MSLRAIPRRRGGAEESLYTRWNPHERLQKNAPVSIIVGDCSGEFVAKARDVTTFVCNDGERIAETVKKAIKTGEPQEVLCQTVGHSKAGEEVARFAFTWKMKRREA